MIKVINGKSSLRLKSPWTKVSLDICPLGQRPPWTTVPWTNVATPPYYISRGEVEFLSELGWVCGWWWHKVLFVSSPTAVFENIFYSFKILCLVDGFLQRPALHPSNFPPSQNLPSSPHPPADAEPKQVPFIAPY